MSVATRRREPSVRERRSFGGDDGRPPRRSRLLLKRTPENLREAGSGAPGANRRQLAVVDRAIGQSSPSADTTPGRPTPADYRGRRRTAARAVGPGAPAQVGGTHRLPGGEAARSA